MAFDKNKFPIKRIVANSIDFAYISAGEGPLILCLHGFPDTAYTYHEVLPALAQAGFHAVAPFMRGYAPSTAPVDHDYRVTTLGQDVSSLITALGYSSASIIGHDWGAVTAYVAANNAPKKIDSIITAAVPHLSALRRPPLAQLKRSWYMAFFQLRFVAEYAVKRKNFALIDKLYRDWSPNWTPEKALIDELKNCLAKPAGVSAALGYYRGQMFNPFSQSDRELVQSVFRNIKVPTLTFAGVDDGCVGIEMYKDMKQFIDAPFSLRPVHGAGHFMHLERPDVFIKESVRFLVGETEIVV